MERRYKILVDAASDIDPDVAEKYDIGILPMHYTVDGEERICDHTESEEDIRRIYEMQRRGSLTSTSQLSPEAYKEVFTPYAADDIPVLYIGLSSGLSGTYDSSVIAEKEIKETYPDYEIECVDSLSATGGIGLMAEHAAINREAGMSLKDNAGWIIKNRLRVQHWFIVDDLMYLKRGGRIPAATAVVGTVLNIKPVLKVAVDGTLVNYKKKRGEKLALQYIAEEFEATYDREGNDSIYIVHTDNKPAAEYAKEAVTRLRPDVNVYIIPLNPFIGSHTGPGLCCILHMGRPGSERARD